MAKSLPLETLYGGGYTITAVDKSKLPKISVWKENLKYAAK